MKFKKAILKHTCITLLAAGTWWLAGNINYMAVASEQNNLHEDYVIQPRLLDIARGAGQNGSNVDVLILFDHQPNGIDKDQIAALGGKIKYAYDLVPVIAANITPDSINAISNMPGVLVIEHDGEMHAFLDQELDNAWGVKRIGSGFAHDFGYTGKTVKVAIIDTGIDYNHPDLAPLVKGGYDFQNNDPDPMDDHDHGTHVSGTVAAAWDGVGVVGVAPGVELYALKVLDQNGSGNLSTIIAALDWCVQHDINVTNQSLGSFLNPGKALENAYDAAYQAGILHVAASGNYYGLFGVSYPARYDSVIAVGATDINNKKAGFTDTGKELELAAPGVDVRSCKRGGGYVIFSGTSMASPHAAGTAALVFASDIVDTNNNGRINDEVRNRLAETAIDLGSEGRDKNFGFGLVNAQAAVKEPMSLMVDGLVRGETATLYTSKATPGYQVNVLYAFSGTKGPTALESMGVLLAIYDPKLAASGTANNNGIAILYVDVPSNAPHVNIWFQAAETGNTSNVYKATIQ